MCLFPFRSQSTESLQNDGILVYPNIRQLKSPEKLPNSDVIRKSDKKLKEAEKIEYNPFLDIKCCYSKPKDLKSLLPDDPCLSIFHTNIRSINKNLNNLLEVFRYCDYRTPDIMAISETKLNENSSIPELPGFSFESNPSPTQAGGVGIYIYIG